MLRLYDTLVEEGFSGSYPTLQRAIRAWKVAREREGARVHIPLVFAPGQAYQFDWSDPGACTPAPSRSPPML